MLSRIPSHSIAVQRSTRDRAWLPELDSRGLSYLLLGLGVIGGAAELVTSPFVPRLVLYALVCAIGAFGLIRQSLRVRRVRV